MNTRRKNRVEFECDSNNLGNAMVASAKVFKNKSKNIDGDRRLRPTPKVPSLSLDVTTSKTRKENRIRSNAINNGRGLAIQSIAKTSPKKKVTISLKVQTPLQCELMPKTSKKSSLIVQSAENKSKENLLQEKSSRSLRSRKLKENLTIINTESGKPCDKLSPINLKQRQISTLKDTSVVRKSISRNVSLKSKKNPIYKNLKAIANITEKENINEVYDFECDSNEEPLKKVQKSRKPKPKTDKKHILNSNYFNYGNRLRGIKAAIRSKETISAAFQERKKPTLKKIIRNIGKIPIIQIVPTVETPRENPECNPASKPPVENLVSERPVEFEENLNFDDVPDKRFESPIPNSPATPTSDGVVSPIPNFDFDVPTDRSDRSNATVTFASATEKSYDDFQPVTCSSAIKRMQIDPCASPWRVEPVLEVSSRRQIWLRPTTTNVDDSADVLPANNLTTEDIFQNNVYNSSEDHSWKKDSILSHYRDVIKSKHQHPTNKPHESGTNVDDHSTQSGQNTTDKSVESSSQLAISIDSNIVHVQTPSSPTKMKSSTPHKKRLSSPKKTVDYFGFEDEYEDQENISPNKQFVNYNRRNIPKRVVKRPCLRELNEVTPRVEEPKVAKLIDVVDHVVLPDIISNAPDIQEDEIMSDSLVTDPEIAAKQVALFEDPVLPEISTLETIPKKVYDIRKRIKRNTQKKKTVVIADSDHSDNSDAEDYVAKAIFRHKKKKRNANVKEKHEMDDWAESFNSMLHEVESYDLCIE